jgi:hypothetical protein
MALRVRANLLDDGVVDTLVSVGAISDARTSVSVNASGDANPLVRLFERLRQSRLTRDDRNPLQWYLARRNPGTAECHRERRYSLEVASVPPQTDTKV